MFDFDPMEPGNPMTLGMLEENGYEAYVNGMSGYCEDDFWNEQDETDYYYDMVDYNYDYDYDEDYR